MTKALIKSWRVFLEILFPPVCLNCRTYLGDEETQSNLLCPNCFSNIKIYTNIFQLDPRFRLIAIGSYENSALRELLHHFKYNRFLGCQTPLEKLITKWLEINRNLIPIFLFPNSCIIPVPLHKKRLRHRGFNQAELIAGILGKHLNLPVEKDLLERTRDTKSQIKMKDIKGREENVKGSIRIREGRPAPQYQNVILVDDVYTSGATIKDAAKALRRVGVKSIIGFVVAKT